MNMTEHVRAHLETCDIFRIHELTVAEDLGISRSKLYRALSDEGTTYGAMADTERERRCRALLERNGRPDAAMIADVAGYKEPNSAGRSFKRWFGMTLRAYKHSIDDNLREYTE